MVIKGVLSPMAFYNVNSKSWKKLEIHLALVVVVEFVKVITLLLKILRS